MSAPFREPGFRDAVHRRHTPELLLRPDGTTVVRDGAIIRRAARHAVVRDTLLKGDLLAILIAFLGLRLASGNWGPDDETDVVLLGLLLMPAWLLTSWIYRLDFPDAERADHATPNDVARVLGALLLAVWLAAIAYQLVIGTRAAPSVQSVTALVVVAFVLIALVRVPARALIRRHPAFRQRAIVLGGGAVGRLLADKLRNRPEYGIEFIGFVDARPPPRPGGSAPRDVLGPLESLEDTVLDKGVDRAFVAFSLERDEVLAAAARRLEIMGVQVDIVPRLFDLVGPRATFHTVEGLPMIDLPAHVPLRGTRAAKRAFDLLFATAGLIAVAPLLLVIALCVRLDSPGPVLYRRELVGRGTRRFAILKFRTMRIEACRGPQYGGASAESAFLALVDTRRDEFARAYKFRDDPRVTKVGAFLRRTSLDELPQLWNVVRGDLSLVGPRAVGIEEYDAVAVRSPAERDAGPRPYWELDHIRPGLTGYWQIHGRSSTSYAERLRLDEAYMTSLSMRLDLLILARTLRELIPRNDAF
jgi:exopolysaccharide biosynthesis polyprenyl glycosylphosphotransferase